MGNGLVCNGDLRRMVLRYQDYRLAPGGVGAPGTLGVLSVIVAMRAKALHAATLGAPRSSTSASSATLPGPVEAPIPTGRARAPGPGGRVNAADCQQPSARAEGHAGHPAFGMGLHGRQFLASGRARSFTVPWPLSAAGAPVIRALKCSSRPVMLSLIGNALSW